MNRYVIEGIVKDLHAGKRIALIGPRRDIARTVFLKVVDAMRAELPVKRLLLANSRETIEMHNGGRLNVVTENSIRGMTVDLLVAVNWPDPVPVGGGAECALTPEGELLHA